MSALPLAQVAGPNTPPRKAKVTAKVKAFLAAIRGQVGISHTEAARLAGFSSPAARGSELAKKFADEVEAARVAAIKGLKMGAEEAEQGVAEIARDPQHRDRLKALETMLKMHGKLSEKLNISMDRGQLNKNIDDLLESIKTARALETGVLAAVSTKQADSNKPEPQES